MPVRNSVFETNSSSTHSISIAEGSLDLDTRWVVDDSGTLIIEEREFGWEEEDYWDVNSKLAYVWLYIRDWSKQEWKKLEDQLDLMAIFTSVCQEVTQCIAIKGPVVGEDECRYDKGYIDHQSVENNDLDYLFAAPELLKHFIFDGRSLLRTDNDNH